MSPHDPLPSGAVENLNALLTEAFGSTHLVRVQLPVGIGADSEPEPDFSVLPRALAREFRLARTQPDRCDLIIEVANVVDFVVEVFLEPVRSAASAFGWTYRRRVRYDLGQLVSTGFHAATFSVDDIFDGLV